MANPRIPEVYVSSHVYLAFLIANNSKAYQFEG